MWAVLPIGTEHTEPARRSFRVGQTGCSARICSAMPARLNSLAAGGRVPFVGKLCVGTNRPVFFDGYINGYLEVGLKICQAIGV